MPLSPAIRARVVDEAKRRGIDPAVALAAAEKVAPAADSVEDDAPSTSDAPTRPVADRLLVGFLPFIKVRELRALWLGLDDRIPDDELTCGDYQIKHGGAAAAPAPNDSPAGGA